MARKLTYKVMQRRIKMLVLAAVFLGCVQIVQAQQRGQNGFGLTVLKNSREFKRSVKKHPGKAMWPLQPMVPQLLIDLKYAGVDNFMKQVLYEPTTNTYLRKEAVLALVKVQQALLQQGLGLKIWDAYRPYSVTVKMWEPVKDERYAANPKNGSGHNRGAAVDLTLINIATKEELDMGTGFDHFSDTAHANFSALPLNVLANRRLLQSLMEANGFKVLDTEWWHFYLPDAKKYELLDLSFKQLKKINKRSSR